MFDNDDDNLIEAFDDLLFGRGAEGLEEETTFIIRSKDNSDLWKDYESPMTRYESD